MTIPWSLVLSKPPERHCLSFETGDLGLHSRCEDGAGSVTAKLSELVFQMLLRFRGYVPDLLLMLEDGDELSGDGHLPTIGQSDDGVRRTLLPPFRYQKYSHRRVVAIF